jgi:hypothetical protein
MAAQVVTTPRGGKTPLPSPASRRETTYKINEVWISYRFARTIFTNNLF